MDNLVNILKDKIKSDNLEIVSLLNFHDGRDNELLIEIKNKLQTISPNIRINIISYKGNIKKILTEIYTSKYQICTRFHHVVISNLFEKTIYNLPYARKNLSHLFDCEIKPRT